jgi:hypothetical protein
VINVKKLIKETTKEERIKIINDMYHCISDCDNCGICAVFVKQTPLEVYQPYINGEKELDIVAREFNERRR